MKLGEMKFEAISSRALLGSLLLVLFIVFFVALMVGPVGR